MKRISIRIFVLILLVIIISPRAFADATKTVGNSGADYTTLKAAFDAINAGAIAGNITLQITANTTEAASAILYQSGYNGTSSYTSINIYPTTTGITVSGNLALPLIDLNGTNNVTIDGRVNEAGSTKDLIITNTSATAGASTIRFVNDANNNTIQYSTLKGSETSAASGVIYFSTASVAGNDNNKIDNNNITCSADANRPVNAIYSAGSSGFDNDNLTISNNSIYDFLNRGLASYGINLGANTTNCTITGNSLYETTSFVPTAAVTYTGIYINNTATGNGFSIANNYIGGQAATCGGGAWSKTNANNSAFMAINLNVGTTTNSSIQGNVIQNFAWSNSGAAAWTGINITAGAVDIGTITGNTIGTTTGTGSIIVTGGVSGANVFGINIASTATVDCENNIIGSITADNVSTFASNFYGIYKNNSAGTTTISNNIIGSTTTSSSIIANSTSINNVQSVYGIYTAGTGTVTMNGNTIANLTNNSTDISTGLIDGICSINGTNTISNNTIHDLSNANANNSSTNTASVCGIALNGATLRTVSGNSIYNLSNNYASFAGSVIGLYFSGINAGNVVSNNFIQSLSVNATSTLASIYGIKIASGATTYSNNIINLGGNTATAIYGIYETGTAGNNNNLCFNTIYIGGSLGSSIPNLSYALYSAVSTNTRNFKNNIFSNARSTVGGTNLHYAAFFNYGVATNLTLDYNDYFASGIGGVLGYYNTANVNILPLIAAKDILSVTVDPGFANAGGTTATDYAPSANIIRGNTVAGITTDYAGTTRASTPTMGVFEGTLYYNVQVWVSGALQAEYTSIKAAFDAINNGTHTGDIEIKLKQSTIETASAILYQSGYNGTSSYTSVNIYPTVSGLSISGNLATPLIDFSGADNVTIDGRVNATGTAKDLSIINTSNSNSLTTSTIRFINDAVNNTVEYCTLKGSETAVGSGVIFFSTAAVTGNDNNTIDNNNITNASDANRPLNAIYSIGAASFENDNLTISNNSIYDFLSRSTASYGINLAANTTTCSISGNSLFETTPFVPTASVAYMGIYINNAATGNGFTITDNHIGGQAASCGGSAWSKSNAFNNIFTAINLNVASTVAGSVQGNTIQNFAWNNSAAGSWTGINVVAGNVNIGTTAGNTIGASSGTGSIAITDGATASNVYGINIASTGTVDCENNTIASITASNSDGTLSTNFVGINKTGAGTTTISNNTIGSSTDNSINANSGSTSNAQTVYGILSAGTGTVALNANTIANLTNGTTNPTTATAGVVNGITATNGTTTINDNSIHDLTIANGNNSATNTAAVGGIVLTGATLKTVSGNSLYNLSNTNSSFAGSVTGLYFTGINGANIVSGNHIYGLTVDMSSTTASIYGIKINSGATTYSNNIINLGGNTGTTIYGIYESGAGGNNNLYFNTVYIDGNLTSSITNPSYGLYSAASANVRNFSNNIFNNARSTVGGSNLHYAAFFNYAVSTNLTLDYNDYYVSGTGGTLGYFNAANVNSLPLIATKDLLSVSVDPGFASAGSLIATDYQPSAGTLRGTTIAGITTDYSATTRATTPTMGALEGNLSYNVQVWKSGTLQAKYTTLKAAFAAINNGTHTGSLEVKIKESTIETASAVLYQSGYNGTSSYTSVNIYPIASGLSVTGNLATPLIDLNGADNVTIDGRVNATGSTKSLIISNTSASATAGTSTIRFINDASNNAVKYCTIKGSETVAASGIVFFSTATTAGNDNNTINNNNITNSADVSRPVNAVYSGGSVGFENNNLTISNNNIYDFLHRLVASNGVYLAANTTNCSITGNSFYETTSFVPTGAGANNAIYVNNALGNNFTITGNYIGGQAVSCGGSAWSKSNAFNNAFAAINLNVGVTTASNIHGNTIKNITWSNSGAATWTGINIIAGAVNIGTSAGNIIGSTTGTGSITVTGGATATNVYGINLAGTGTIDCENNIIGSVTADNASAFASNFYGINKTATAGTITISNNTIGSTTTANSINATSASTANLQNVYGILNAGSGTVTINTNTVANLTNSTTNATPSTLGLINGICSTNGANTISNNTIRDLTIGNTNNSATNTASVTGIALLTNTLRTVSGNTIYNLSNTNTAFTGNVIGLYFSGSGGANVVSGNFIRSLSVNSASTAALYGIKIASGVCTYSNNIINLGGNTATTVYGIYETGAAGNNNSLYFNTVYIGGTLASGKTNKSYALFSNASTNVRNFRNNIFNNSRSTPGGSSLHYAAYLNYAVATNLTLDYNDYYASSTGGGVLASYNATDISTLSALQTTVGQNLGSISADPNFASAGGTLPTNYVPAYNHLVAVNGTGITTDYSLVTRSSAPTMGAFEISLALSVEVWKSGTFQAQYPTLKTAFDKINDGTHTGTLELRLTNFTAETTSAILYQSGYNGTSSYTSVNIYPTVSGLSVSGNLATPLIDLNGADNVTIDGRVNATGSTKNLLITNASNSAVAGTSTIRFINDATTNTVKYCTLKGSETIATSGVVLFSTAAVTGNDNNIIDNNSITSATSAARPINAVYSAGSATFENSNITISNNTIFDFLSRSTASYGINLAANTTICSITGNSLFETTAFVPTASVGYIGIYINNTSGNGHTISGNYIGGQSAACGGSAWTKTNAFNNTFTGINLNVGTTTTSNVQGNTIKNFAWSNSLNGAWTGITITGGNTNIGTTTANTIGATTGTGSIGVTSGTTGNVVTGILLAGTGLMDCENNLVGSISTTNVSTDASTIYGINRTGSGVSIISNNIVGSTSTANSINATSASTASAQSVVGINNTNTTNLTINANKVVNLTNGSTNTDAASAGLINGITTNNGTTTITNNTIYNLTIANANSSTTNTASVCGIASTGGYAKTVSGNTIYNLSNTYAAFAGSVMGIYYGGNNGVNTVSGNFIYGLTVPGSTGSASLFGIKALAGATTYSNNIINLSGNTQTTIYGIYDTGASGQTCNLYFNTVYIGGSLGSSVITPSYALYSNSAAGVRNFRNNLFVNARSTAGGASLHYAAYFNYNVSTLLTMDFNNYLATGTGGVTGYYNSANVTSLPLITGLDVYSTNVDPGFAVAGGTTATNYTVSSNKIAGTAIAGITTDYAGTTRKGTPTMGAFEGLLSLNIDVYKAGVWQSTYFTLKDAFDKINNGTHTGALEIRLKASTTETASAVLYQSGYSGLSNYTSIVMYPTVSGLNITGNLVSPLIDLNGADNFTIDGRVNATGSTRDLLINNTNTGLSSTFRFINTAENNTIKYCTIKGSNLNGGSGIVYFSTAAAGNGNSTNTFDNNNFTGNSTNRPVKVIYSAGSVGFENKANVISNNSFYDFLNPTVSSYGMDIASNSLNWNISSNSFYETTTFAPNGAFAFNVIRINTGDNNQAIGNYIGGSAPLCGGSPWTIKASIPHYFAMIFIGGGASTPCVAQNNVISNIDDTSTQNNPWDGIYINAGNVNVTGNTVGATTGNGAIKITTPVPVATAVVSGGVITTVNVLGGGSGYTTAPVVTFGGAGAGAIATANLTSGVVTSITVSPGGSGYTAPTVIFDGQNTFYSTSHGIRNFSTGTVNVTGNNVGAITTAGTSTYSHGFESIIFNGNAGTVNISNNLVGSLTTPNSIYTSSTAASSLMKQDILGIFSQCTGTATISGNTVANLTNGYTGTQNSSTKGIYTSAGSNSITNNTVRNISAISLNATVYGISQICATGGTTQTITGNTVYNLANTNTTDKVDMYGIYNSCPTTGTNTLSNNFVYGLTHASSNVTSNIYGIYEAGGASTLANNIVSLGTGVTTGYGIYGIYDASITSTNLYFNTVYIGGTTSGTTTPTYGMISSSNASTRNYRNNVFDNARTGGITGKHYAIRLAGTTGQTINYNDYFVGAGGVIGYLTSDRATLANWITATAQDANSLNINPYFTSVGSAVATDYKIGSDLPGVTGTGITTDFNSTARNTPPSMGAWEVVVNKWKGTTSTDWNTATNWTKNTIPTDGTNLYFDPAPLNNCLLNANHTVNHIFNAQSTYRAVTNGNKLTIKGDLILSNGAQIDATATNSTIEFAGALAQSIPSGTFYNNGVYNLIVNNASNVTLNGTLSLLNNMTPTLGKLEAVSGSPTFTYSGTAAQTIDPNCFLSDNVYALIINNAAGVTLNTDVSVNNLLTINAGKSLTIPTNKQLNVVGTITNNAGVSGLYLQASSSAPNGSLIFHNAAGSPVSATVEMYSKAFIDKITNPTDHTTWYKWQFFGIPVSSVVTTPTFDNSYIRDWHESNDSTHHWVQLTNSSVLVPFYGYEICQPSAKKFAFQGQLVNSDFNSGQLPYTVGTSFSGQSIFANPYTAAIDIKQLTFGTQTEATVYMYNTGSIDDWTKNDGGGTYDNTTTIPGQYTAVPKLTAGNLMPGQVPSMQAMLVKAMSNSSLATFGISYNAVATKNTDQQRVHASTSATSSDKVCTMINVDGKHHSDKMWLFTDPGCTHGFDNGWDGFKLAGSALTPQLYAVEGDGNYQVNAVDNINNTLLNFQAGEDVEYMLTFTHQNTKRYYEFIYLIDLVENRTIDITESGSTYAFIAQSTAQPVNRFKIATHNYEKDAADANSPIKVFSSGKTVFIQNSTAQTGELMLFDAAGHYIKKLAFGASGLTKFSTDLIPGAYIAKAITSSTDVAKRLIIL